MKLTFLPIVFLLISSFVFAQEKALTETGDEVILYEDGTWEYVDQSVSEEREVPMNPNSFTKPEKATFLLKSKNINTGFWIDPKKWSFIKSTDNPDAEYELNLREGDLYGMIITEKIEIPLETLKVIALENAKSVAPNLEIMREEYRMVNGIKVLHLEMKGTIQGIKFTYFGYYYSNEKGTVQYITFTAQNLMDEFKEDVEELLNGLVELSDD